MKKSVHSVLSGSYLRLFRWNRAVCAHASRANENKPIVLAITTNRWFATETLQRDNCRAHGSILDLPVGSLNEVTWNQGVKALKNASFSRSAAGTAEAWAMLDRLLDEEAARRAQNPSYESRLDPSTLLLVIHSWFVAPCSLTPQDAIKKLDTYRTKVPDFYPDIRCYNVILDAAIKTGDANAHIMGEEILRMLMNNRNENPFARPNAVSFNTAINALAKSGAPDAHLRAEALLQQMKALAADGWEDMNPNAVTFGCVISAWGESGHPDAPKRAEELLHECGTPDDRVFNALLNVWAKSDSPTAADRCFQILRHMQQLAQANTTITVEGYAYGNVIAAFAKRGRAKEAESVLHELIRAYEETKDPSIRPNRFHFTALIDAHSKSDKPDSAFKAEQLLYRMEEMAQETGNLELMPSTVTYSSVLNAWAKSKRKDIAERGEAMFQRMLGKYTAGDATMKPTARCYCMLLDCYAKSGSREAAIKAEETLQTMMDMYRAGDEDFNPNVQAYGIVLDAWSKSNAQEAPERAEALLKKMEEMATEEGFSTQPNMHCYSTVLTTWARSGREEAVCRAEVLMKKMNFQAKEGNGTEREAPSIKAYGALLDCYSRFNRPQEADFILHKLCNNYLSGKSILKPNGVCCRIVISAWSRSNDPNAASKADHVLERMKELDIKRDTFIYNMLISVWANSGDLRAGQRAVAYLKEMKSEYQAGARNCKPDRITYANVMSALSKSKLPNSVEHARSTLDEMKAGGSSCQPDQYIYQIFVTSIASCDRPDKAQIAYDVLAEMEQQKVHINIRTLNAVLQACTPSTKAAGSDREAAFQIAAKVFTLATAEKSPDEYTFGHFFCAAAGLRKDAEVEQAFRLCCEHGLQHNKKIRQILQQSFPHLFLSLFQ